MFFTRHTDLRNKTPLFAEAARRTAYPRAAEGVRVCEQNITNVIKDFKDIKDLNDFKDIRGFNPIATAAFGNR